MGPKALVAIACLVNLLAGFGFGVTFGVRVGTRHERHGLERPGETTDQKLDRLASELCERLAVTPEQEPRVRAVLRARLPRFEALISEVRPRLEAFKKDAFKDLEAVLTPAQVEKLRELDEKHE
ncbi:MAG TPA: hypothetical protein VFF73_30625 [Planctomycetota bacterium]|nr:hypothetical protein [Planctomycetota bacterium]